MGILCTKISVGPIGEPKDDVNKKEDYLNKYWSRLTIFVIISIIMYTIIVFTTFFFMWVATSSGIILHYSIPLNAILFVAIIFSESMILSLSSTNNITYARVVVALDLILKIVQMIVIIIILIIFAMGNDTGSSTWESTAFVVILATMTVLILMWNLVSIVVLSIFWVNASSFRHYGITSWYKSRARAAAAGKQKRQYSSLLGSRLSTVQNSIRILSGERKNID